jgi:hypothetical protein
VRIQLELDKDTSIKLVERSVAERRPVPWQAEILLRQALGPSPPHSNQKQGDGEANPDCADGAHA